MNISVFCGVIAQFMYFGQYGKPVKVSGGVSLWNPSVQNFSVIEALEKQKTFDAFCASPRTFDYWYDDAGSLPFVNHTCLPVCKPHTNASKCLSPTELSLTESADTVLLVTQIQELISKSDASFTTSVQNFFVPAVEVQSVRLAFSYEGPGNSLFSTSDFSNGRSHSSHVDTSTVLVDHQNKVWKTLPPGSDIMLSVSDMMHLAGYASLDRVHTLAGRNYMPKASITHGPTMRISGI